jgi:uncharacterized membrane protein
VELGFERPTPGQGIAAVLLGLAAFAYPLVGDAAIERFGTARTAAALLATASLGMAVRFAAERRALRILGQNAGALVLLGLAAGSGDRTYLLLFPALINIYLAVIFAASVTTEKSIVERGARIVQPYLPPFTLAYCRKLTLCWSVFFAANSVWIARLCFDAPEQWRSYTAVVYPAQVVLLSLVEFFVRKLWFRNYTEKPLDRLLASLFPPEANERGRRSQRFIATLHAAGYGRGGARRGQPLDPAVVPDVFQA